MSRTRLNILRRREPLRVGFLPVSDCAPLVYAQAAGLFAQHELEVDLVRQNSWASVLDRIVEGDLDAAQAPATLPFLASLGTDSEPTACISGLVLSLQGNAITISRQLWDQGVRDAQSLRAQIYQHWRKRTYTFGVVFSFSPSELLLRRWLASAGIAPETEVRIVAVPPAQMFPTLKLGYLDGFCVGEPWTSVAVQAGVGRCLATSATLAPLHPEKVLMVRQSFAAGRSAEHEQLMAALLEACAFCDEPQNRPLLSQMLADRQYVDAAAECLQAGLAGEGEKQDRSLEGLQDSAIFHRHNANEPSAEKAGWIMDSLNGLFRQRWVKPPQQIRAPLFENVFRPELFHRAKTLAQLPINRMAVEPESELVKAAF